MKRAGWTARSCAALAALGVVACGLSTNGLEEADEGGLASYDASPDTTLGDAGGTPGVDSSPAPDAASDSSPPPDSNVDSTPPLDAPAETTPCANTSDCNGGCCSFFACVAFDNNHCGGSCTACSGETPTCGADGNCNGDCGGPGDGTCQTSCCNAGTCAAVGNQSCGDYGAACVSCNGSDAGSNCELLLPNYVCGCDGPASQSQCRAGNACHNQQCSPACDGQHPCNGGCCSGNDVATSTCVASCDAGMNCTGNYCQ